MIRFLVRMAITALGVLVVAYFGLIQLGGFVPGQAFTWSAFGVAFIFAVVLGLVNGIIKPIVKLLTLPISILTLGIFSLLVNLAMFYLAAWFLKPNIVLNENLWLTALAAIIVAVFSGLAGGLTRSDGGR
jgi:putative membrane protein